MGSTRNRICRRAMLRGSAAAVAAPWIVPRGVLGGPGERPPSDRITLGFIGLGSMGMRHIKGFLFESDCQITSVCDVDTSRRQAAVAEVNKHYASTDCVDYSDFDDLIAHRDLDTVCLAIPDHWHTIPAMRALRAGKDVYGEKPLALTIPEGRAMVRAVRRHGRVWQMGSWQRSTAHFRFACELIRNGRIGRIKRVEIGLNKSPTCPPQPAMPVPKGFDYDRWLGPAPEAPYTEKRCHWNFRWILDYSGGQVTDSGAHDIDIAHWAMGLDHTGPVEIEGAGDFPADGLWDVATTYKFRCRYAKGATPLADGPLDIFIGSTNHYRGGCTFYGETGKIMVSRAGLRTEPASLMRSVIRPGEIHLGGGRGDHRQGHRQNFLDCVRTRSRPITPIEVGHHSIAPAHLGNIAMRLGRRLRWDPDKEHFVHDAEADRMLRRPMRAPWAMEA